MKLKTCPILSLTPEVESVLRWFFLTHALVVIPMVGARYERVGWPEPGEAGAQDAWRTRALSIVCETENAMLMEEARARAPKRAPSKGRHGRG
jgi:hypothetical protein